MWDNTSTIHCTTCVPSTIVGSYCGTAKITLHLSRFHFIVFSSIRAKKYECMNVFKGQRSKTCMTQWWLINNTHNLFQLGIKKRGKLRSHRGSKIYSRAKFRASSGCSKETHKGLMALSSSVRWFSVKCAALSAETSISFYTSCISVVF